MANTTESSGESPAGKKLILNAFFMNQPSYVAPGMHCPDALPPFPEAGADASQESGDTRETSNGDTMTFHTG